mgnify:CR=1 FL=1
MTVDDVTVTGWKSFLTTGIGSAALVGLGAFLVVVGLDDADKWASVIGVFVGLIGLAVSVCGLVLARRSSTGGGQAVTNSLVGGRVVQARGVQGSVRVGPSGPAAAGAAVPPAPAGSTGGGSPPPNGQSVGRSRISGPVYQVDGVGGDADIDR